MEHYHPHPASVAEKCCCDCGCSSCSSLDGPILRSVKRKYDEFGEENKFTMSQQNARVEIENECVALREAVVNQQETIQGLISELEEERDASSSAANETMSMILRLQREKAEIEMEAKQFKRFMEERITHDQREIAELEELLYKREDTIEALTCEIQAYKHQLMSYGLTESEVEAEVSEICIRNEENIRNSDSYNCITKDNEGQAMLPGYDIYPSLKCNVNKPNLYLDDVDRRSFGESPRSRDGYSPRESPRSRNGYSPRAGKPGGDCKNGNNVFEKEIVGHSPRKSSHHRRSSSDSTNSSRSRGRGIDCATFSPKHKTSHSQWSASSNFKKVVKPEAGEHIINKVCTVEPTQRRASSGVMDSKTYAAVGGEDVEIQKLYARLHALETDRETMRQAILSMGTDKAHLVMLKEIAQNLVKEMAPSKAKPVQERSIDKSSSYVPLSKWVMPILLWRRNAQTSKYTFGQSANNTGLLSLIDRKPLVGSRRILNSANLRHL